MKKAVLVLGLALAIGTSLLEAAIDPIRINCGGTAMKYWEADRGFNGGSTLSTLSSIGQADYAPQRVYQSSRTARSLSYGFPEVPPGRYLVRLHFADYSSSSIGQRRFNVKLQGVTAVTNLDVFATAGGANRALLVSFYVTTVDTNGVQIKLTGSTKTAYAILNGIEILPPSVSGMTLIPAGSNISSNLLAPGESYSFLYPSFTILTNGRAFYMDHTEVTKAAWDAVRAWGLTNGYTDLPEGLAQGPTHPVHDVSWYDSVKWCNARSQKEGKSPAYYTTPTRITVYKKGKIDLDSRYVKASDGYRLPTELEWEFAARGGLESKRFPWGNTISHTQANYFSRTNEIYDVSPTRGYHPDYIAVMWPYTSPVGSFSAHGYGQGLYDMAGNMGEWCWDAKKGNEGLKSTVKSGLCMNGSPDLRVGARDYFTRKWGYYAVGFRTIRPATR
jgi:hypothetical protein